MGTDIHFYVEKRVNGKWVSADVWETDNYGYTDVPYGKHFYQRRNYDLFAILADVRNGRGFAGVVTGAGFNPICPPKGLPDDMSPELEAFMAQGVDHTPSWLTVAELLAYDWTQVTTKQGNVDLAGWGEYKTNGEPSSYCGAIGGPNLVHVEADKIESKQPWVLTWDKNDHRRIAEVKRIHESLGIPLDKTIRTVITWETPYYHAASEFLSHTLPRLWRLGEPADVRCVFYFDN